MWGIRTGRQNGVEYAEVLDIEAKWQINGFIANEGPVTAVNMYVRIVANRICTFQGTKTWGLLNQGDRGRTFEEGGEYEYVKDREYYAELRTSLPLHPGHDTCSFQCVEVHGLVESGMEIEVTVFAQDQAPLTTKFVIDRRIHEQIASETKDGTQATIHRQPPRELRAIS